MHYINKEPSEVPIYQIYYINYTIINSLIANYYGDYNSQVSVVRSSLVHDILSNYC